jgi:hypothetical protein
MRRFLYFVETQGFPGSGDLGGIPARVPRGMSHEFRGVGPGGLRGVIYTDSGLPPGRIVVDPERQRWLPMADAIPAGRVWVGAWEDAIPGPEEQRAGGFMPRCFDAVLGDGRTWTIPQLCYHTGKSALPQAMRLENGVVVKGPQAVFRELCRDGERLWRTMAAALGVMDLPADEDPMREAEILRLLSDCLALHYRVSDAEVGLLGLFTEENFADVACRLVGIDLAVLDRESLRAKKTRGDSASGSCGSEAESSLPKSPTTGLPLAERGGSDE